MVERFHVDVLFSSLSIGLLATASPCVLPLYPGYLAYLSGGLKGSSRGAVRYLLGFAVLAGVLSMMLILGAVIAALSVSVGQALSIVVPFADSALILLGILLLLDKNPFARLPQVRVPVLSQPLLNAYVYGFLYGPIALPCSGPFVVSIFALSLTPTALAEKLIVFLGFGLGFGLPLLLLSLISGAAQRSITGFFTRYTRSVNLLGGIVLIGLGLADFTTNWPLIVAYLR
jgi:cytochrome c-type biogenesis protein